MDERQPAADLQIPLPVPNLDNEGFWEGCRQHQLRLQSCRRCGQLRHPPRPMCPQCTAVEYEWAPLGGRGTIYSFTIVHGPTLPVFAPSAPYNVVVVQLAEGPFIVSNVVGCAAGQIRIGMPVEVVFEDVAETTSLPKFRPV
ncbi:MAG TPA: Zn-ribbon domain-containing OB-fold protein [Candidatus Acidoferrales bacterium]|nr:Zn-ribbon domain-containing OB-fold protein [Candidatus Acidoferrales bacterium]